MIQNAQKVLQTLLFFLWKGRILQLHSSLLSPAIKSQGDLLIGHLLLFAILLLCIPMGFLLIIGVIRQSLGMIGLWYGSTGGLSLTSVQNPFNLQHPLPHSLENLDTPMLLFPFLQDLA